MMRIFAEQKTRRLFGCLVLAVAVFALPAAAGAALLPHAAAFWVVAAAFVCTGAAVCTGTYLYLRAQDRTLEHAAAVIRDCRTGNPDARIPCEEEGELCRLFHEVNALAAVLNAHAENESRSRQFLKDTLSDISHQLKTPLAALNVYNGLLQQETQGTPSLNEYALLSEQELDRIAALVQDLLKIARLDAGTVAMEKKTESVRDMMAVLQRRFAYRAVQEHKHFLCSGADCLLPCDRNWLPEAIGNLVKNAFDHTQQGGTIRVEWRTFASIVQIVVRDNGSGIPPEDLPHIFKRFYRSRFSSDTQGVGLGLPLAKAVIEAHGGTIEVDSAPGAGTTFTVNFPIPTKL